MKKIYEVIDDDGVIYSGYPFEETQEFFNSIEVFNGDLKLVEILNIKK